VAGDEQIRARIMQSRLTAELTTAECWRLLGRVSWAGSCSPSTRCPSSARSTTCPTAPADITGTAAAACDQATAPLVLRPRAAIEPFFGGITLERPGLVRAPLWRPDAAPPQPKEPRKIGINVGVAARN